MTNEDDILEAKVFKLHTSPVNILIIEVTNRISIPCDPPNNNVARNEGISEKSSLKNVINGRV